MKKRKFKKIICLILSVILMTSNLCDMSFAFLGWYKDGDKMTYLNSEGYKYANTWKEADGWMFYLNDEGYVIYNKVFDYNGNIFCVNKVGARVTNEFVDVTADMIDDPDITPGTYYFSSNGSAYRKNSTTFSKIINGKKYAFDEEGHLLRDCWLNAEGDLIESDILTEGVYYVRSDGTVIQNAWYDFTEDAGADEDLGDSELISEDYDEMSKLWMYFGSNGKKYTADADSPKLKKLRANGREYAFDEKGILVLGFEKNRNEVDYNQQSNPVVSGNIRAYDEYEGNLIKDQWLYCVTPQDFDEADYYDGREYWFYVGSDGTLIKNKMTTIDNKKYVFDGMGRLRKGFVLIDGISYFVAEYKAEDLSKDDFIYSVAEGGKLYGSDLSDIRYFDESEDQEGEMLTGTVKIELNDGKYDFNFRSSNGKAVGNKNELKLYQGSYYRNGLKFIPWEDTQYGIVKVDDDEYRVINSQGRMIKAKKRVIKDDFENYMIILNNKLAGYIKQPKQKIKLRWNTFGGTTGYYYYDLDMEATRSEARYTGLAVASGTVYPTDDMLKDIPNDMKVNFR